MNQRIPLSRIIPMNPDALGYGRQPNTNSNQSSSNKQSHNYQNVVIGNGMMTVRVNTPNYTTSNSSNQLQTIFVPIQIPQPAASHFVSSQPSLPVIQSHITLPVSKNQVVHAPKPSYQPAQSYWNCGGTIISEVGYRTWSGQTVEAIFLGQNRTTGKYELFRGSKDPIDSSPSDTARRETCEETSNFFNLSSKCYNDQFKVTNRKGGAHFYIVRINPPKGGIQSKLFDVNKAILSANHAPSTYLEMRSITRISISDAISSGITNTMTSDFIMRDVYGNMITICEFDAKMISRAIQAHYYQLAPIHDCKFINAWNDSYNGGSKRFLDDTCCYKC